MDPEEGQSAAIEVLLLPLAATELSPNRIVPYSL
jgi:hypothetical protein